MRHLTVFGPAACAVLLALAPPAAQAGAQQGVRCPSGFTAAISDGDRKLVCRKSVTFERDSICPPVYNKLQATGSDLCINALTGASIASIMLPPVPAPGQPLGEDYRRVVNPNGPDKFVATRTDHAFPEAGPLYIGDAGEGVVCPVGFDGDKAHNERGIRCDKNDGSPRSADCDGIVGWEWKRDLSGAEDRCRHIVSGETGPTKPEGMTKVQHDLERASNEIGWVLDRNAGARDTWQRKVYKFPIN